MTRRFSLALAFLAMLMTACGGASPAAPAIAPAPVTAAPAPARPDLLLATTTSTQDSGLLDVLIPDFQRRTGYKVKSTAVGTGAALALGAKGDADALLVHAPSSELEYMSAGNGDKRVLVMHNDFIVVGPPSDPAKIAGKPVLDALKGIAAAPAPFISRGDKSGTDVLEKALFVKAGIKTAAPWYIESGTGMGDSLTVASEKKAYIITDRATYLARKAALALDIFVQGGLDLLNVYHVITVSSTKFPKVNTAGAEAFAAYLVAPTTQTLIGEFGKDKYGQPLFFPDAGKNDGDLH